MEDGLEEEKTRFLVFFLPAVSIRIPTRWTAFRTSGVLLAICVLYPDNIDVQLANIEIDPYDAATHHVLDAPSFPFFQRDHADIGHRFRVQDGFEPEPRAFDILPDEPGRVRNAWRWNRSV